LSPDLTEVLVAIGAADLLVGVTDFCRVSVKEVREKPSVGGFLNPNLEIMVSLRPDLVVGLTWHEELLAKLREASLPTLRLSNEPLADALESMGTLAAAVGRGAEGEALVSRIRAELDAISRERAGSERPRVLVVAGRNPGTLEEIYVAGGRSFMGELTSIAGGENVFQDSAVLYPRVSKEEIVARDPEVILELFDVTGQISGDEPDSDALLAAWGLLPTLSAVKSGRLFFLDQDFIGHPGPHIPEIARVLAEAIHARETVREPRESEGRR
jgi:iron complex transport system substrate-binding protein